MTIGPIVALVLLRDDPGSASFVLTAIGLGIVVVGVLIVSNVWKTPTYNVIMAWDPAALPADWDAGRRRSFAINGIQLAVTWAAFARFLVALISLEATRRAGSGVTLGVTLVPDPDPPSTVHPMSSDADAGRDVRR
jgi:hypothetical protein